MSGQVLRAMLAGLLLLGVAACPASTAQQPQRHLVTISGMAFKPATLQVRPGDIVEWHNEDLVPHTASADKGGFESGDIAASARWTWTAAGKGEISYFCRVHPSMKGVITVE